MNNKVFKIYRSRRICIPAASLLVLASSFSCKEAMYESIPYSPQERGEAVSIGAPSDALWIKAGETLRPTLVLEYENGETAKVLASDIGWSIEDPSVAVGEAAGIKGLVPGTTMVKAAAGESSADFTLTVKDGKSTTGITAALTEEHIYSKGHYLDRNSVIQGFDITGKGDLYYMQIAGSDYHNLAVIRTKPNKGDYITDNSNVMYFKYFGHGTNFAVEEAADGDYIWIGSYGSKNSSGEYWNSQTIARVKYEPGKTVTPDMCDTHFYIGARKEIHPALDVENDVLAVYYPGENASRCVRLYSLSDAMALPPTAVTLQSVSYGGNASSDPEMSVSPEVNVKDLRMLTSLSEISFQGQAAAAGPDEISYYDWQGFDLSDGLLYWLEGEGSTSGSLAYLTVMDCYGNTIEDRTAVAAASDKTAVASLGITSTGFMEAEGVKVHNGHLYIGFASRDAVNDKDRRRANVLLYDQVK